MNRFEAKVVIVTGTRSGVDIGRGSKMGVGGSRRLNPDDEFRSRYPGCPIRHPAYRRFVTVIAADPHV
jgi:hypothetical protein